MADYKAILRDIRNLTPDQIDGLSKELKAIKKEASERQADERAAHWKKDIQLDDRINFKRGREELTGNVEAISHKGVRVQVPGGQRARTVKFSEIVSKK